MILARHQQALRPKCLPPLKLVERGERASLKRISLRPVSGCLEASPQGGRQMIFQSREIVHIAIFVMRRLQLGRHVRRVRDETPIEGASFPGFTDLLHD